MSIRSLGYDSEQLDLIFLYFMRTALRVWKSGVERLPVTNNLPAPWKSLLDAAMGIFLSATGPEIGRPLLEAEHAAAMSRGPLSVETALGMELIKDLTWHIRYDEDPFGYLLATENLWGNDALEYASLTLYPSLPEDLQEKYHIRDLIACIPPEKFRLEDD